MKKLQFNLHLLTGFVMHWCLADSIGLKVGLSDYLCQRSRTNGVRENRCAVSSHFAIKITINVGLTSSVTCAQTALLQLTGLLLLLRLAKHCNTCRESC